MRLDLSHIRQPETSVLRQFEPSAFADQDEDYRVIAPATLAFTVAKDATVEWNGGKDNATAKLDGGKAAEVSLKRWQGNTSEPVVIQNLKYWGAPRNDGFILMPNVVEAARRAPQGQQPFEFKGTNGFMITFDISSKDVAKK